jgi:alpha-glucosidase
MKYRIYTLSLLFAVAAGSATTVVPSLHKRSVDVDACPGYNAKNIKKTANTLTADLQLAGKGCNVYGADIAELRLEVTYDDGLFIPTLTYPSCPSSPDFHPD